MQKEKKRLAELELDQDTYYILLTAGTGDTLIYCGLRRQLEEKLGGKVYFLIRSSHEVIMKMYGLDAYDVIDCEAEGFAERESKKLRLLSDQTPRLRKGAIWVAYMGNHRELNPRRAINREAMKMRDYFEDLLQLPATCWTAFEKPSSDNIQVSAEFKQKIADLGELSQTVLMIPGARTDLCQANGARNYWQELVSLYKRKGYRVIANAADAPSLRNCTMLDMSLEELLWVGLHCHSIHALRSGACDLLAFLRGADMTIVYASHLAFYLFNFYDLFRLRLHEVIINQPIAIPQNQGCSEFYLFGHLKLFSVRQVSPEKRRFFLFGLPVASFFASGTLTRMRVLGITLYTVEH